ncbi:HAD hydrolase-like protein [Neobacillus mesonae]|uniref:Nucleosidase n=1 Tax=Neobacillus mesonae TaxID=1193713 RepID=A0A3Q9QQS3_9BACI|nr:HAD hydrolase-like protein [Neobacillus mesonae]AZU60990.1 nucleosidase [Neobacillus mesonae]
MLPSIIFDMDGTLFQTNKILELSLEDTFNRLRENGFWGQATPIEQYRMIMGVPLRKVWETLLPDHSNEIREQANEFFHERLIGNIKHGNGALYPNAEEVLGNLKAMDCSIFIASNGLIEYLSAIVDFYGLNKWVTETFSIQQINSLDKADLIGMIIKKYNLNNAAVVGDRISDIKAAKQNGLIAIGCNFDFAQEDELSHADIVIGDLIELKTIVHKV